MTDGLHRYEFEKPVAELQRRLLELRKEHSQNPQASAVRALEMQLEQLKRKVYDRLAPWQRVQLARHPLRPYTLDYIKLIMNEFVELHGDRCYGDDKALVAGVARLDGQQLLVLGHQKGRDTKENLMRNFGSAHPEGYRKALRLMQLAAKRHLPIVIFIDTPGAYPGIGAEERGQAHSIALNMREMARLRTSVYICVIGEGGSGGALGVGVGDWVVMLEHAYYSVISPEGCAAILWRDRAKAPEAAEALKLTAKDLLGMQIIDEIIDEPLGGAHHDPTLVAQRIKESILRFWKSMRARSPEALVEHRYERFRRMGVYTTDLSTSTLPPPPQPVSSVPHASPF